MLTWGGSSVLVPGSTAWLLERVDLRVQLDLRTELRRLRDATEAVLTLLWIAESGCENLLEFAGERRLAPTRFPQLESTVASFGSFDGLDGTVHEAIITAVRLGRGVPRLGLLIVDPANADRSRSAVDTVDGAAARLESIVVRALVARPRRC